MRQCSPCFQRQLHGQLDRQQPEERGEFDHWIQGHGRCVLERIAHRVAYYRRVMQRRAFLFEFDFNDLLRVIPRGTRIGHKNSLVKAKDGDGDQVADKKERLDERERQRCEEHGDENIQHAFLGILRADFDNFLAVGHRSPFRALEIDIRFNELDSAISARSYRLRGCAREPINHRAAGNKPQKEGSMQQRKLVHVFGDAVRERHNNRENHGGRADHSRTDEHGFCGGFESVPSAVVGFEQIFGPFEVYVHIVIFL